MTNAINGICSAAILADAIDLHKPNEAEHAVEACIVQAAKWIRGNYQNKDFVFSEIKKSRCRSHAELSFPQTAGVPIDMS